MAKSMRSVNEQAKIPRSQRPEKDPIEPEKFQLDFSPAQSFRRVSEHPLIKPAGDILNLQRTLGNKVVGALLGRTCQRPVIQAKLMVNEPGDQYEQEADRIAEHIMRMPVAQPGQQFEAADIPDILTKPLTVNPATAIETSPEFERQLHASRGYGEPLPPVLREDFGGKFGVDFSGVRIHANAVADQLNRSISALAFTAGQDVYFRHGAYNPQSRSGQELLAHELTHVVQQGGTDSLQPVIQRFYLDEQQPLPAENKDLQAKIQTYKNSHNLVAGFNQLTVIQAHLQKLPEGERQALAGFEAEVKKERNLLGQLSLIGSNIQYCLFGSKKDSYRKLSGIADIWSQIPVEDIQGAFALNLVLSLRKQLPQLVNAIYQLAHLEGKTEAWALSVQTSIEAKIQTDIAPAFAAIQMPIALPEAKPAALPEKTGQPDEVIVTEPEKAATQSLADQNDELSDDELAETEASTQNTSLNETSGNAANTDNNAVRVSSPVTPPPSPPVLAEQASSEEHSEAEMTEEKTKAYHAHSKDWYGNGEITGTGVQLIRTLGYNPSMSYSVNAASLLQKGGDFKQGIFWEGKVIEVSPGSSQAAITSERQISLPVPEQTTTPIRSVWPRKYEFNQAGLNRSGDFSALNDQKRDINTSSGVQAEKFSETSAVKPEVLTGRQEVQPAELTSKLNQPVSTPILAKPGNTLKSPEIIKPSNTNKFSTPGAPFGFAFFDGSEQDETPAIETQKTTGLNKNVPPTTTTIPAVKTTPVTPSQPNKPTMASTSAQPALANPPARVLPPGSVTGNHGLTVSPDMIDAIRKDILSSGINSKWADQHEIGVLASNLGIKIIVHYPNGPSSENGSGNDIYELYYNGKDHYDAKITDPASSLGYRKQRIPGDGDCFYNGMVTIASASKNRNFSVIGLRRIVHNNLTDADIADIALPLIEDFKSGLTNPSRLDGIGLRFKMLMRNRQQSGISHYSDT
jgi:hypothetical protein